MFVLAPFGTWNHETDQEPKTERPKYLKSGTCPPAKQEQNLMALAGAAVGAILGELLKSVLEIRGKIEEYNSVLKRIETILKQIEPILKEIDDLNGKLNRQGGQTELLWGEIQRGKDLMHCCKNEIGGCCSCFKKPQYQYLGKLQELDKSLSSFYDIVVSLHTLRETIRTREITEDVRDKVVQNQGTMESINESVLHLHRKVDKVDQQLEVIGKILAKDTTNNSAADASNKSQRPSGYASGDEIRSASSKAPTRVPERSVTPVLDQRKQVPGDYGRANSNGKDGGAATFSCAGEAPKEYGPPSPVPWTSGLAQIKPNLKEDRHEDQTKRVTKTAYNVPPRNPSPPPKSPEVVWETRHDGPAQILPYQSMDSPWEQTHVQPASRQFKQVPDKAKEVPTEPAYSTSDSSAWILPYQVMDSPWQQPHVQPEPRQIKKVPDKVEEVPKEHAYTAAISTVASNDSIRGASLGKERPSGRHSSYPVKPAGPATANYGFSIPPKSPETKAISPAYDQYWNVAPAAATAANPAPPRPYIPPDSHEMVTTNFAKDPSVYSSSTEKRSTRPTSSDDSLTRSHIPQSSQPRTKEVDHDQADKWKTGQSNPGQTIIGTVVGRNYALPLANKALPTKAPEIKKGGGGEWRRYTSTDQKEYWSSDWNDE